MSAYVSIGVGMATAFKSTDFFTLACVAEASDIYLAHEKLHPPPRTTIGP